MWEGGGGWNFFQKEKTWYWRHTESQFPTVHKNSNLTISLQVQITRFVVAPQSSDQEEQLRGEEAADLDVDMEGMDHVNEDSFMTDESIEEQRETTATGTDEGEALYDPAEITSVEESQESQIETAPQLEVSSSCNFWWNAKCCNMHIFAWPYNYYFFLAFVCST